MTPTTLTSLKEDHDDHYVVIGNPIAHSKSPEIHRYFATETGEKMTYTSLEAPMEGFEKTVREFIAQGGRGANVTAPFKQEAFALATRLTARAKAAGAVNTLTFQSGEIVGDNTDGVGLVTDIVSNAGVDLKDKRIVILGAGGAARGVLLPLLAMRPKSLILANRTVHKAMQLVDDFKQGNVLELRACSLDDLGESESFDVMINATSASLHGISNTRLPAILALAHPHALAYDMNYGLHPTPFMQQADQHGAIVRDGLGMLVEQAAEAFFVWRGVRPETKPVLAILRETYSR